MIAYKANVVCGLWGLSLVLGIIGIPAAGCTVVMIILPLLALILGGIGISQVTNRPGASGKGMAIAGIICGVIGVIIELMVHS